MCRTVHKQCTHMQAGFNAQLTYWGRRAVNNRAASCRGSLSGAIFYAAGRWRCCWHRRRARRRRAAARGWSWLLVLRAACAAVAHRRLLTTWRMGSVFTWSRPVLCTVVGPWVAGKTAEVLLLVRQQLLLLLLLNACPIAPSGGERAPPVVSAAGAAAALPLAGGGCCWPRTPLSHPAAASQPG